MTAPRSTTSHRLRRAALAACVAALGCGGPAGNDAGDAVAMGDTGPVGVDAADARADAPSLLDALDALDAPASDGSMDVAADRLADASACTSGGAYPAGPYGTMVGQPVTNYSWRGIAMPVGSATTSTAMLTPLSLQDLRPSGCRYAILHITTPG